MPRTLIISDELERLLGPWISELERIIEAGLREINAEESEYSGVASLLKKLAALPSPEEVLKIRASKGLQQRISQLLEKNRNEGLTVDEEKEMERYLYLDQVVQLAKVEAFSRIRQTKTEMP